MHGAAVHECVHTLSTTRLEAMFDFAHESRCDVLTAIAGVRRQPGELRALAIPAADYSADDSLFPFCDEKKIGRELMKYCEILGPVR